MSYTVAALLGVAAALVVDLFVLRTGLVRRPVFWATYPIIVGFQLLSNGIRVVPAELVANSTVLKHLPGIITLFHDAGYNDEEALRWLYTVDETVDGCPAIGLGGDRAREVKRRAQALGF